jgi:hypothetical protein
LNISGRDFAPGLTLGGLFEEAFDFERFRSRECENEERRYILSGGLGNM